MREYIRTLWLVLLAGTIAVAMVACAAAPATEAPAEEPPAEEEPAEEVPAEEPPAEEEPAEPAGAPEECAEEGACAVFEPGTTIKIGYAGPLSGDVAAYGQDISQGGQLAIEDFGQDFNGFSFELLVEDGQGTPEGGAAVANLYCANPEVVAIAGHTFSGETASAIPIYNECRLPMMSPSATNPDLTGGDQDVFNRIPFTDAIQGRVIAEFIYNELELTQIAVMHDGQAYGQGLAEIVRDTFTELGGEVVAFEPVTPGQTDYSAVLNAVAAGEPEAIFYGGYHPEAAVVANQKGTVGLGDAILVGADGIYGATLLDLAGDNAEGIYATAGIPPASDARAAFDAAYEEVYGVKAGELSTFSWHGYDIVAVLIEAVEDVAILGEDGNLYVPRDALVERVRATSGYEGLTGDITCDETGECNASGPTFNVVQDGAWVEVQ